MRGVAAALPIGMEAQAVDRHHASVAVVGRISDVLVADRHRDVRAQA
jgi:hypothetical protein